MEITRRCDYACRIIRAAYQNKDAYSSIAQIAEQEDIPYSFARSIQYELVKAGILRTTRGVRGGLTLNCNPAHVTLKQVVEAIQGPVNVSPCSLDKDYCPRSSTCSFCSAWCGLDVIIDSYLSSITLCELFELKGEHPVIRAAFAQKE